MEERVAERLHGALGPLGFEVHAFKVLTSCRRAVVVTSPAVASSCREMPPSLGAGCLVGGVGRPAGRESGARGRAGSRRLR